LPAPFVVLLLYVLFLYCYALLRVLHSFPTRRSSDLNLGKLQAVHAAWHIDVGENHLDVFTTFHNAKSFVRISRLDCFETRTKLRSEEHTSELQSRENLVCRLLLEKKKKPTIW